jgi:hypothetical protein
MEPLLLVFLVVETKGERSTYENARFHRASIPV